MNNQLIKDVTLEEAGSWDESQAIGEGLVLGNHITNNLASDRPHRANFILMALCLRGEARYAVDTRELHVKRGDLFFVSENHVVDYYDATADFKCLSIMLSTPFYHSFVLNVQNVSSLLLFSTKNPVVALNAVEETTYINYFEAIKRKMSITSHPFRTEVVKALLLAMFYDMSGVIARVGQEEGNKTRTRSEEIFALFIREVSENFRQERRVSWYAQQQNLTPKYLSEAVKRVSKRTPNEWIDHYVLLELRVLLKNTTMNIREIAIELNFPNQSFLGKFFKEHMGMSPSEFRRQ